MINKELLQFKNELLKELREIEIKLDKKLEKQSIKIEIKNQEQEDKINLSIQKNDQVLGTLLDQKTKIEKLSELYISQKKLNDMLISHEMRINNLLNENKKLEKNYDKIIIDNLTVPGYIGSSCTFKNLSEYIQSNINDMEKIKNDKISNKKITDDIKIKVDNFFKNMLTLVDNSVTRCNKYTDNKQVYMENILKNKLVEFDEKNMELRTQLFTNFSKTIKQLEKFEIKFNELKNLKEDVNNEIELKFKDIIKEFEENKLIIKQNIEEITNYKKSLNDLIDKRFDNLIKSQKNNSKFDFKFKKNEEILTPKIKSFRGSNKREDLINTFNINKNTKNNNNIKNENINDVKSKLLKRFSVMNSKGNYRNTVLETKEDKEDEEDEEDKEDKEEKETEEKKLNQLTIEVNKSIDESTNKIEDNNIIKSSSKKNNNILFKDIKENENKENEIKENEIKEKEKKEEENKEIKDKKINELKINNNFMNKDYPLKKVENKKNIIQSYINNNYKENKNKILDSKIINETKNKNIVDKNPNSYYINNIKNVISQKQVITDINFNNNNIKKDEKYKIRIPKIENLKNNEKELFTIDFESNKNIIKKYNLEQNNNIQKKIEIRNLMSKSTGNTFNYIQLSKEKEKEKPKRKETEKEKDLKSINSDNSFIDNKDLYNTSPKFYSIETQTSNLILKNKKKGKFPKIGFSYKIINLGSDINFKERNIENYQSLKETSKTNIDLSKQLTNTYKAYQKKKNIKKINNKFSSNELPIKELIIKKNFILPKFNNNLLNNNSFHKKHYRNIDFEYINLKKKKNSEIDHSIESVKSSNVKIVKKII